MRKILYRFVPLFIAILMAAGCGKQEANKTSSTGSQTDANAALGAPEATPSDGPAETVAVFLEAVRTGNDEKASRMLSTVAREKTASLNRSVTPPASDTARFSVGKVDWVGQDGARVACTWTDLDADGQPRSDEAIWVVRREAEGWRVVGVAAMIFPDEPPVVLNFEDPDDMVRQQNRIRDEIRRRMQKELGELQAKKDQENKENPVRR